MKKIYFPTLLLVFSLLTLFSCTQKDETFQSENQSEVYQNLTGAEYLNYYSTPDVFFNLARVNEDNQKVNGWIIDKTGTIFTYETSMEDFKVYDPILSKFRLTSLQNIAQSTGKTIDLVELVDFYKKTRIAASGDFVDNHNTPSSNISIYFNAYDLKLGNGACLYCPVSQVSENEVAQLVLETEGIINGNINNWAAKEIVDWMFDLDQGL